MESTGGSFHDALTYDIGADPDDEAMVEFKYTYLGTGAGLPFTVASTLNLNNFQPAQGLTFNNRIGNKVILRQLRYTAQVIVPPFTSAFPTAGVNELVRIIVFVDKQPQTPAVATDLLITDDVLSEYAPGNCGRFIILTDHSATIDLTCVSFSAVATWFYYQSKFLEVCIDCEIPVHFPDGSTAASTNSINLLTVSKSGIAVLNMDNSFAFTDA